MGPFTGKRLIDVNIDDLRRLVDNAVAENIHLEYKRELSLDDREARKELLRDLTAFANAQGGTIIFGMDEERDSENKPTGTPKSIDGFLVTNRDSLLLALESLVKDGVDERLPAFEMSYNQNLWMKTRQ